MSEKKKMNRENDYQVGSGAKFTCSKFGGPSVNILAAGDDQRNVLLWKLTDTKPKMILTGQSSESYSLLFDDQAQNLYSGTVGGTVHVWDLNQQKEVLKMKGHATTVTCMAQSKGFHMVTGSQDTKVKLWDLRQKSNVATFREHTGAINTLGLSPDGRWVASGSADGSLKIWDIYENRVLANFQQPNQSVTCLSYNPHNLSLANGSSDRTVKYWDLEQFSLINTTFGDTGPISHIAFSPNHPEHLFTVCNDNIRLWNIENNTQLDCLSVPPKQVSDLQVAAEKQFLLLSCIQNNTLSVYYTSFDNINQDESVDTVPSSSNQQKKDEIAAQRSAEIEIKAAQAKSKAEADAREKAQAEELRVQAEARARAQAEAAEAAKKPFSVDMDNQNIQAEMLARKNQLQGNIDKNMSYVVGPKKNEPAGIDMNDFMKPEPADPLLLESDKQKDIEIINEIMEQHTTLVGVIQRRRSSIQVILNYCNKGQIANAINGLTMMNDTTVVMDTLNNTFAKDFHVSGLNYEIIANLIPLASTLVHSKYEAHILAGLKTIFNILKTHGQPMRAMKTVAVGRGVDLAREERLQKCDYAIDKFFEFSQSKGFTKAMTRPGEVQELAQTLHVQLTSFLNATKANPAQAAQPDMC